MTVPTPTASWPLPSLITSLKRAGWGTLHGRKYQGVRSTLLALEGLLPHRSGEGRVTAWQISEAAGLSERWTRRCLSVLEELGIIRWSRGTIIDGKPAPSFIRVHKRVLATLVRLARGEATRRLETHRRAFNARLQAIVKASLPPYKRESVMPRAELYASPTTLTVEERREPARSRPLSQSPSTPLIRKEKPMAKVPTPYLSNWPTYCPHEGSHDKRIIYSCVDCRWNALTDEQIAEYDADKLQEEKDRYNSAPTRIDDYDPAFEALRAKHPELSLGQLARLRLQESLRTA